MNKEDYNKKRDEAIAEITINTQAFIDSYFSDGANYRVPKEINESNVIYEAFGQWPPQNASKDKFYLFYMLVCFKNGEQSILLERNIDKPNYNNPRRLTETFRIFVTDVLKLVEDMKVEARIKLGV